MAYRKLVGCSTRMSCAPVADWREPVGDRASAGAVPEHGGGLRPRSKGVRQVLSEAELDGIVTMLQAGASNTAIRAAYGVGRDAIRDGLKARGLTTAQIRLQRPVAPRGQDKRLISVSCSATSEEYKTIRAYAVEHGMTISEVVRTALVRAGLLDATQGG